MSKIPLVGFDIGGRKVIDVIIRVVSGWIVTTVFGS